MSISLTRSFFALILSFSIYATAQKARQPLITRPIDDRSMVPLRGNTHPLARPMFDVGGAPSNLPMDRMLLVLKRDPQQDLAIHKLLDDQQDKNSPNYHKWLTPAQFGSQFGTSDQDIQLITGWLQSHGFQINRVSNGRTVIEFSGIESQVEQAFHTQIHQYAFPNGEKHWANASDPQIPAALAPAVAGVWSMHDFKKKSNLRVHSSPYVASPGLSPLFTSNAGKHALMPGDFAIIYNLKPLYAQAVDGRGTTIAIVGRSDFNVQDVINFRSQANLGYPSLNVVVNGQNPGIFDQGEEFEAVLDATWSGAVAPGANLNFVTSASTNTTDGVDLSEIYIIDNNIGDVMTESFSSCEGFFSSAEAQGVATLAQQAAAEGITYMVSTGDSGAEGCVPPSSTSAAGATPSVNLLAATPFTVAIGGTMFNENNNNATYWNTMNGVGITSVKSYIPENVWNESCPTCGLWATGGGASTFFSKPNWQFGVSGIPRDGARDLPDVSLSAAAHDPYLVCFEGSCFYGVSGTSASAPSFAGIMALIVQQYGRQGAANYVLYRLAATENLSQCNASSTSGLPNSTCIFNDVTKGNNAVPGELNVGTTSAQYQAGVGYDLTTGLGSVNGTNLVTKWNTVTFNATTTTLGPSTISGTHGTHIGLSISVAPSSGSGTPTGDVSLQTGLNLNANPAFLTLANGSVSAQVANLPGGSYTLTARYGGDSTYAPSTSNGTQVNISPESTTTAMAVLTQDQLGNAAPFTSGPYGSFVYPRADVSAQSGQGTPTGNVQFLDNGQPLGLAPFGQSSLQLNSAGSAAPPNGIFTLPVGNHSLQANYNGDPSFSQSSSASVPFSIAQASTTTTVSIGESDYTGTIIVATVDTNSRGLAPTGTVTFYANGTQLSAPAATNGGTSSHGTAQSIAYISSPISGNLNLSADYGGDSNYLTSSSAPLAVSPDFTLWSNAGAGVVFNHPGQTSQSGIYVYATDSFTGTVTFACSGQPPASKCSFAPTSLSLSPSNPVANTTVSITTSAATSSLLNPQPSRPTFWGIGSLILTGFVLIPFAGPRVGGARRLCLILIFGLLLLPAVSCGGGPGSGGGGNPGTKTGSYPITVKVSSGTLSHTATFTLVVQ